MRPVQNIGAIAQLGERNTGSVEVGGSIPPSSTKFKIIDYMSLVFLLAIMAAKQSIHLNPSHNV